MPAGWYHIKTHC